MSDEAQPKREADGKWSVVRAGEVLRSGLTHADAWKAADRINGEVTSPSEKRADYGFRKASSGE